MLFRAADKHALPDPAAVLPGRATAMAVPERHFVTGNRMTPPFPDGAALALFGMGCFWGAERLFWGLDGVHATAVGYAAGATPNPTYEEVCSGRTGHNEVVRVIYDPARIGYARLLATFWEGHDPTQGMRQGNDAGTQYRSGLYTTSDEQAALARESHAAFQAALSVVSYGPITSEILPAPEFYYAEDYHQQYLAKNPMGYCGLGGTGVACPTGLGAVAEA